MEFCLWRFAWGVMLVLGTAGAWAGEADWVVYDGYDAPGYGRHIVLVSGDEEYRSEEALPQLGKILAQRQGFKCTVLFAQNPKAPGVIDPNYLKNIPGLEALRSADLMIIATRFRELPDAQMKEINDYLRSGRPVVGLRTANHGFRFPPSSKWAHYGYQYAGNRKFWQGGFGQPIFGSIYISHHGWHGKESTRGLIAEGAEKHPIVRGIEDGDIWGATDVYGVELPLPGDSEAIVLGQVLDGMSPDDSPLGPGPYEKAPDYVTEGSGNKNDPMMPVAWTKSYRVPGGIKGRVFSTSLGAASDLAAEGTRRMIVNGALWCLGIDPPVEGAEVALVGEFEPSPYGTRKGDFWKKRDLRVADFGYEVEVEDPYAGKAPEYPYMDVREGRGAYEFAGHARNRFRLYDFYRRQAEDALSRPERGAILPEFPGIDGGAFDHWGRYSKNDFKDRSWNLIRHDVAFSGILRVEADKMGPALPRAVAVRLAARGRQMTGGFDTETLRWADVWVDGFIGFHSNRYGIGGGIFNDGEVILTTPPLVGWSADGSFPKQYEEGAAAYHGHYRHGDRVVFSYRVEGLDVLESAAAEGGIMTRTVEFRGKRNRQHLLLSAVEYSRVDQANMGAFQALVLRDEKKGEAVVFAVDTRSFGGKIEFKLEKKRPVVLGLEGISKGDRLEVHYWAGRANRAAGAVERMQAREIRKAPGGLEALTKGGPEKWKWRFTKPGKLGDGEGAFAIDRIPVPLRNPYGSVMMIGGHDFFSNGDAAVCTMLGDVWRVSGLDAKLGAVSWRRIATGLNQALGVWIERGEGEDELFVLGRDRINRLHDLNGNGEIDYYENYSDAFETAAGGHSFFTGLQRDGKGNFYFAASGNVVRVSAGGSEATIVAKGLRNPNGIGVREDGLVVVNTNEGGWTPTNMVLEVREGDFYGLGAKAGQEIAPALCYLPRGLDNSAGGQVFVTSEKWGALEGRLLSFSYGAGLWSLVLRSETSNRTQGAMVPLPGDFASGAHRGRFGPHDGQLYVSGGEGWGNYAIVDGGFDRVRYTGKKFHLPVDWRALENGIVIRFSEPIDGDALDPRDFFCQQWNYEYSSGYGSAEYSVREPGTAGHDVVNVRSARLLHDRRSVFLEIPGLAPAKQTQVYGRLQDDEGEEFVLDLYATILSLDPAFTGFRGHAAVDPGKESELALRVRLPSAKRERPESVAGEPGRPITVTTAPGLQFATKEITVAAGERISLTVENADSLPHNLVIVKPGTAEAVGELANAMITDPSAVEMHYVPDSPDVLFATDLLEPQKDQAIHFNAPQQPGEYPYLCTFPGHWMLMRGVMVVR